MSIHDKETVLEFPEKTSLSETATGIKCDYCKREVPSKDHEKNCRVRLYYERQEQKKIEEALKNKSNVVELDNDTFKNFGDNFKNVSLTANTSTPHIISNGKVTNRTINNNNNITINIVNHINRFDEDVNKLLMSCVQSIPRILQELQMEKCDYDNKQLQLDDKI